MMQQSIYFKNPLTHADSRLHTHAHTHAHLTPPSTFQFQSACVVLFYIAPPRPIWCPFVLCGPHDTTKPWK